MNHSDPFAPLRALQQEHPTLDACLAAIARHSAELALPKGTIHVLSDVHGEDVKLRHVINNASGTLRPIVEKLFEGRLAPTELSELLKVVFYPRETLEARAAELQDPDQQREFCLRVFPQLFEILRHLSRRTTLARSLALLPHEYRDLLADILFEPSVARGPGYFRAIVESLLRHDRALHVLHLTVRTLRNLCIDELIIAGDCFDRGPRADRVVDYLMHQPNVSFAWGNHDVAWIGACLGHEALIAHVLRVSCRYRRLSQLEEGYGITLQPLEHLVRAVYSDDAASCFVPKGTGLRETITMARMQKAAAILQYKLEGQVIDRNPSFGLDHRRLLHRMDLTTRTVEIDGVRRPLKDTYFPTIDPADPYRLTREESACMDRLRESFLASSRLWEQVSWMVSHGSLALRRDDHLIFHGCVPSDQEGNFLSFEIDGVEHRGRELFEAFERVVSRAAARREWPDLDKLWYLWCGPRSPLFGKDRICTFENDLVEDKAARVETKDPYFKLIHQVDFCNRVMEEFEVDPSRGLIVNGHVPVKLEKGENPMKDSGKAITIDGAFSEAYGDHGFTLVLEPERTLLAKHHHFESVEAAVKEGVDIVPEVTTIRTWDPPRTVADTERGSTLRGRITLLEDLARAYRNHRLRQGGSMA